MRFPATFIPGENGSYEVVFTDLPGCFASGASFEAAMAAASKALATHMECLIEAGAQIPAPSSLEELIKSGEGDARDLIYKFVPMQPGKAANKNGARRISISIRPNVLARLDSEAGAMGLSRSALIAMAVNDYCARRKN